MTTVAVEAGDGVTVVTVVRGWVDEVCAMQQPMTTQTTMTAKSTIDPTVTPTAIPATLARERYKKALFKTYQKTN